MSEHEAGPEPSDAREAPELTGEARVENLERLVAKLAKALGAERDRAAEDRRATEEAFLRIERQLAPPEQEQPEADTSASGPVAWIDRATAQQWHDLAEWVDWLSETYELQDERVIYDCWPAHPGIVEELAALWCAWCDAARRAPDEGQVAGENDALAFWHDRYLAPMVYRLHALYAFKSCKSRHEAASRAPRTDRDLLPPMP